MAITYPNSGSSEQGSAALTFAYTLLFTPTAGNSLIVGISGNDGAAGTTYSVKDSTNTTYAQDELVKNSTDNNASGLYRRDNIPSGITSITITCSVSTFLSIAVAEQAGSLTAASFDVGNTNSSGVSGNSATPGSYTPTTGDAGLTVMTHNGSGTVTLTTATSGWSVLTKQESTSGMPVCMLQNLSTSGAQNPVTTISGSAVRWSDAGGSYKVAAASAKSPPPYRKTLRVWIRNA